MGVAIGASSVPPSFAIINSSYSNELRLALIAGLCALAGAVIQGKKVSDTIGSGLLKQELGILQGAIILLIASSLVIVSVISEYPMPTAFTVVGSIVGSSFGFGQEIIFSSLNLIVLFWILTPIMAIILAFLIARIIRAIIPKEKISKIIYLLLLLSGSYVAYTAGAASVGLAIGPLISLNLSTISLLIPGGIAILFGSWIYSPRIIHTVSYDYSSIGPRRSTAALLASGLIAQVGVFLGVPVSFNLAIIPSVIGSGLVKGKENQNFKKTGYTVIAWISAFFIAASLAFISGETLSLLGLI